MNSLQSYRLLPQEYGLSRLSADERELAHIKRKIDLELILERIPFVRRQTQLPELLERAVDVYSTVRGLFTERRDEFISCARTLKEYLGVCYNSLDAHVDISQPSIPVSPNTSTLSTKQRLQEKRRHTEELIFFLEQQTTATLAYENLQDTELKVTETQYLLELTTRLSGVFTQMTERLERQENYLRAVQGTFRQLLELKGFTTAVQRAGSSVRDVISASYDVFHQSVSALDSAVTSFRPPALLSRRLSVRQ